MRRRPPSLQSHYGAGFMPSAGFVRGAGDVEELPEGTQEGLPDPNQFRIRPAAKFELAADGPAAARRVTFEGLPAPAADAELAAARAPGALPAPCPPCSAARQPPRQPRQPARHAKACRSTRRRMRAEGDAEGTGEGAGAGAGAGEGEGEDEGEGEGGPGRRLTFSDKDEHMYFWFPLLAGLSELTFDPRQDIRYSALEVRVARSDRAPATRRRASAGSQACLRRMQRHHLMHGLSRRSLCVALRYSVQRGRSMYMHDGKALLCVLRARILAAPAAQPRDAAHARPWRDIWAGGEQVVCGQFCWATSLADLAPARAGAVRHAQVPRRSVHAAVLGARV